MILKSICSIVLTMLLAFGCGASNEQIDEKENTVFLSPQPKRIKIPRDAFSSVINTNSFTAAESPLDTAKNKSLNEIEKAHLPSKEIDAIDDAASYELEPCLALVQDNNPNKENFPQHFSTRGSAARLIPQNSKRAARLLPYTKPSKNG